MKNLIKADLSRIRKTKLLYFGLFFMAWRYLAKIADGFGAEGLGAKGFLDGVHTAMTGEMYAALYIVLPVFIAVFSNEISSKSMQCILGHGLSRGKLIGAKLIDSAILVLVYFVMIGLLTSIFFVDDSLGVSPLQVRNLIIYLLLAAIRYYGYIVFSAMVMFLTGSETAGIVMCVAFSAIFSLAVKVMGYFTDFTFYDYTFDGWLDAAYRLIEAGRFGWQIFPAALLVAAAVYVTIIFFRRKEFEF